MKDLISLHDLTSDEVKGLLELGLKLKKEQKKKKKKRELNIIF